ncbi:hypothetical protein T02_4713 [Trichinella nativa]|uniref:Uncharacterized protein n=1 Tax=Trichinella nativa TaxID=6335 RepID=A0A0V1LUT1_9BILA|nr:hypothetical protein T02_4713 [Trichinella nativa]
MGLSDLEGDVMVLCTRSNIRLRKTSTVWCTSNSLLSTTLVSMFIADELVPSVYCLSEVLHSLISEQSVMETFVQQRNQETLLQINDLRRINGVYARKQR